MIGLHNDSRFLLPLLLLAAERGPAETEGTKRDAALPGDEFVACALCAAAVTSRAHHTVRHGRFEHIFTNPSGFVYRVGCFAQAPGCLERGERTDFFSWFPGYAWSFVLCRRCATHLGWRFTGRDDDFFGLILANLKNY